MVRYTCFNKSCIHACGIHDLRIDITAVVRLWRFVVWEAGHGEALGGGGGLTGGILPQDKIRQGKDRRLPPQVTETTSKQRGYVPAFPPSPLP